MCKYSLIKSEKMCKYSLIKWKNDKERKPMILRGARQVGKTWLMKEFGKNYYKNYVISILTKMMN